MNMIDKIEMLDKHQLEIKLTAILGMKDTKMVASNVSKYLINKVYEMEVTK